ncbi:MAG: G5 domain-containing protein, partial [Bifidobacterium sp.]|nr:G5 domain-containing protein [Bifidobacterium sp.]
SKDKGSDHAKDTSSPSASPNKDAQSGKTTTTPPQASQPSGSNATTKPDPPSQAENTPAPSPSPSPSPSGLWHAGPGVAQAYASGAAAQRGWTGSQFDDLVKLWNKESGWQWDAENPSGAYGIPQSLPGSKMSKFGDNWHDDAAIQIDWGLWYIAQQYGNPSTAWRHSEQYNWY